MLARRPYLGGSSRVIRRIQTSGPEGYARVQSGSKLEGGTLLESSRQSSGRGPALYASPHRHSRVDEVYRSEILAEGAEIPQCLEQGLGFEQVYMDALTPTPNRHGAPRVAGEQVVHSQAFKTTLFLWGRLERGDTFSKSKGKADAKRGESEESEAKLLSAGGRPQDKKQLPE